MHRLHWQRLASLSLFAILALGVGAGSRADDHGAEPPGHATTDDHGHADEPGDGEEGHGHDDAAHVEEGHGDGHEAGGYHPDTNMPPIFPDQAMGELFVFSLIFFCLYVVVAKKVAWVPLIEGLDAREARVNRALADAEAARIGAQQLLARHQQHLDQVTEEVKEIIAQARGEAEQEKARIISDAEAEANAMRDQAIADIHAAREQALFGLDERIDAQVATATEHVLG